MVKIETESRIPICSNMADVIFFQNGSSYISAVKSYPDEIWYADRLLPSQERDATQSKIGSSIVAPQLPS